MDEVVPEWAKETPPSWATKQTEDLPPAWAAKATQGIKAEPTREQFGGTRAGQAPQQQPAQPAAPSPEPQKPIAQVPQKPIVQAQTTTTAPERQNPPEPDVKSNNAKLIRETLEETNPLVTVFNGSESLAKAFASSMSNLFAAVPAAAAGIYKAFETGDKNAYVEAFEGVQNFYTYHPDDPNAKALVEGMRVIFEKWDQFADAFAKDYKIPVDSPGEFAPGSIETVDAPPAAKAVLKGVIAVAPMLLGGRKSEVLKAPEVEVTAKRMTPEEEFSFDHPEPKLGAEPKLPETGPKMGTAPEMSSETEPKVTKLPELEKDRSPFEETVEMGSGPFPPMRKALDAVFGKPAEQTLVCSGFKCPSFASSLLRSFPRNVLSDWIAAICWSCFSAASTSLISRCRRSTKWNAVTIHPSLFTITNDPILAEQMSFIATRDSTTGKVNSRAIL